MMPKTETIGDYTAEEWSTPVNWKEDPAIKAKRRSLFKGFSVNELMLVLPKSIVK